MGLSCISFPLYNYLSKNQLQSRFPCHFNSNSLNYFLKKTTFFLKKA
ncbi:maltose/maltodextrin-binding protein [Streptococcus pyogenes JRS4]|nr:maltose/maltodextrin-binding protein [Streptococcus pyogenes JRS4]